ncbi:MAG: ATP-grasp domain-containing protein [Candidatus Aenigmatarchaeota archaeon]
MVLNFLLKYRNLDVEILTASWERFPVSLFSRFSEEQLRIPESGYLPDYGQSYLVKENKRDFFVSYMEKLTKKGNVDLVIPLTESTLVPLSGEKRILKGMNIYPSHDSILCLHDKTTFVERMKSFNPTSFSVPKAFSRENVDFPCFVKPTKGCGSHFSYRCESNEELNSKIRIINNYGREPIIQEFIDGKRFAPNILVDKDYNIVRALSSTKIPPRKTREVFEELERFFEGIGYYGFASPQFLIDNSELYIMEINPRLSASPYGLGFGAGFPKAFYRTIYNEENVDKRFVFTRGILGVWESSLRYSFKSADLLPVVKFLFSHLHAKILKQ